jgi:hypothetical protein
MGVLVPPVWSGERRPTKRIHDPAPLPRTFCQKDKLFTGGKAIKAMNEMKEHRNQYSPDFNKHLPNRMKKEMGGGQASNQIWVNDITTWRPTKAEGPVFATGDELCDFRALICPAGVRYASHDLETASSTPTVSTVQLTIGACCKKGGCYDNASMESWNHSHNGERFGTRVMILAQVFEYIEVYYNHSRLHPRLVYHSQDTFVTRQTT